MNITIIERSDILKTGLTPASGLTIYAVINKLITEEDSRQSIGYPHDCPLLNTIKWEQYIF